MVGDQYALSLMARTLWLGLAVVCIPPSQIVAKDARPEIIRDGPSATEQDATRRRLHASLSADLPSDLGPPISLELSNADRHELEQASGPGPLRIGVVKPLAPAVRVAGFERHQIAKRGNAVAGGVLQATDDGGFVWAAGIASPGAARLRLQLSEVDLPPRAALYFIGPEGEAHGPYRGRGPNDDGDFWTDSVSGSLGTLVVRHTGPASPAEQRQTAFVIAGIGHIATGGLEPAELAGEPFCGNASCVIDVSCLSHPAVSDVTSAVAQLQWIAGAYIYTCTGGLLADTVPATQIPYLLTANHCLSRGKDARNLEAFFFYRTSACGESCPSNTGFPRTLGAAIKATNSTADFTLLTLNQMPPAGTKMLGWNSNPVAFTAGLDLYRISHPNFGAQVFSHHRVDATVGTCGGWPRGERIYSQDIDGAIGGGSSGSPVVNGTGQVVGQLSGICGVNVGDPCDAASNSTVDGAFASYFSQVAPFLDPPPPSCGGAGASCNVAADCCSNNCKGPLGRKTCK
jgi:hypothetical protein